jgi:hypothetical protein
VFSVFIVDLALEVLGKSLVGRARIAYRRLAALLRDRDRVEHRELGRPLLVGVIRVPSSISSHFCRLALAVLLPVVEHADEREAIDEITPVLILHQLAEQFARRLQLRRRQMLLTADHEYYVFDHGVV